MNNVTGLFFILPIIVFFLILPKPLSAQALPGKSDSLHSAILNEERLIQVVLPPGYKPGSAEKYDVLYVLDGEGNTALLTAIQQFTSGEGYAPPLIVVGIINTDRVRDFLPTHNDDFKTSGGAANFLQFLKSELIPYIDKTYPSNGNNTLFGHSFGGVLVTYAMITEPQLFNSYIAADPSYWWDHGVMVRMVADKLPSLVGIKATLFITGREGPEFAGMGIPPMDSLLKKSAPAGLSWKLTAYPGETHGSVRLKTMYEGLRFSYAGYNSQAILFHPMGGVVLKDKPMPLWFFSDTANTHFTTDGSIPTRNSPAIKQDNTVPPAETITIKRFATFSRFDKSFTGHFTVGDYLPAGKLPHGMRPGGLNYTYFEGQWDSLPDFKKLKTVKTGTLDSNFSLEKLPKKDYFAVVISGQLEIQEPGYYLFGLDSDDGTKFYLADRLLINYDGMHGSDDQPRTCIVPLQKGFYPLRLEYFQKDGDRKLDLEYITPAILNTKNAIPIPLKLQYGHP